ncbi:wbuN domain protein, partial [Escherichia coli 2756500]
MFLFRLDLNRKLALRFLKGQNKLALQKHAKY